MDIITSSEYYQRKLIFTNTKTQNNAVIYEKILVDLKKRADARGEVASFTVQQIRTKFKRCIGECKQAAMKIKNATGIECFQDEKGFGKWFNMLFPLVKTRDSCQPDLAVEPSSLNDLSEEEEVARTLEDFVPVKKIKLPKKNNVSDAIELLKRVVEQDPAKELITFMREESEKARKHELALVELMLKHGNTSQSNASSPPQSNASPLQSNESPPQSQPITNPTTEQANTWNGSHQYFRFQSAENPQYPQSPGMLYPPSDTRVYGNCFIGPNRGTYFQE